MSGRGDVDTNGTTVDLNAVHLVLGGQGDVLGGEGDETETTAAAGVAISDNLCLDYAFRADAAGEGIAEGFVIGTPREVTDEETSPGCFRHVWGKVTGA